MSRKFLLALLTPATLLAQGATSGGARPVSLEEAVRLAQRNSPQTIAARGQVRSSDATARTVLSGFLPSLSMSLGGNFSKGSNFVPTGGTSRIDTPWNFSRSISSNLEVFDGGRRWFNLQTARANQVSAESNERLQQFQVALDVKQQYFNVLAARESRAAAAAQLAQAEEQLKASIARVSAGAATVSDSLRSIIQVGNARLAVLTAENAIRVANAALTRLVGTPYEVTAATSEELAIPAATIDSSTLAPLVDVAPAVQAARSQVNASVAAERASRTSYLPTFSLGGTLSGNRSDESFAPIEGAFRSQRSLRLSFSYPLFNGLQREETVIRARIAEDNARAELRDAQLAVQQQLTQFLGALSLSQERVVIQVASVAAAEEDLRVQQQRYTLGASTLLDVLTSQSQLNSARVALIQARYDARVARAQIESIIGRDLP
jgi:outer membrane protein